MGIPVCADNAGARFTGSRTRFGPTRTERQCPARVTAEYDFTDAKTRHIQPRYRRGIRPGPGLYCGSTLQSLLPCMLQEDLGEPGLGLHVTGVGKRHARRQRKSEGGLAAMFSVAGIHGYTGIQSDAAGSARESDVRSHPPKNAGTGFTQASPPSHSALGS